MNDPSIAKKGEDDEIVVKKWGEISKTVDPQPPTSWIGAIPLVV